MKEEHCLDISFPSINLDSFIQGDEKVNTRLHAHLTCSENEIELKIFFEPKTNFDRKLRQWVSGVNWKYFGTYVKVENEKTDSLLKIDLSQSRLLKISTGSNQVQDQLQYVLMLIDSVKFYFEPIEDLVNTGEFYLNPAGFSVVKDYYAPMFEIDGNIELSRMNEMSDFYKISKSQFRPEFNFWIIDRKDSPVASITKEPKFQFKYSDGISETEAFKEAEIIRSLTAYYFRSNVDYIVSKIYLKEYTIIFKKIQEKSEEGRFGNLWEFGCELNFDSFLKSNWQSSAFANLNKLSKSIDMFIQSISVDKNSRFLLMYNIIEVCMGGKKESNEKFTIILKDADLNKKYEDSLTILLETVDSKDHEDFKIKWAALRNKLSFRPMKSPLLEFLEEQKFKTNDFPITLKALKDMRDKITHGSTSLDPKELENANVLLYRISGILILNLIGINSWTLNTKLPN